MNLFKKKNASLRRMPAFPFYIAMMGVLALATLSEKIWGTEWTSSYVYQSWWFTLLWAHIAGFSLFNLLTNKAMLRNLSALMLHLGFIVILAGAYATRTTGKQGLIHLRIGEETQSSIALPFRIELEKFDIPTYPGTDAPSDYVSHVRVWDEIGTRGGIISMNHIFSHKKYRLYQSSFDEDGKGSWLSVNHDPIGIPITYTGYAVLTIGFIIVLLRRYPRTTIAIGTIYFITAIAFNHRREANAAVDMTLPVLRSTLIGWHVAAFIVGYTLLIIMAVLSVAALARKNIRDRMMRWNRLLLLPSEALLATGIFLGAIWANLSWGRYWAWDPKEVWALITLMAYALPLHPKSIPSLCAPKTFHIFIISAILMVAMTYYGVNYLLGGIHSYGA